MSAIWFIGAVVALQVGAATAYALHGSFKLAAYWLLVSGINAIAATF